MSSPRGLGAVVILLETDRYSKQRCYGRKHTLNEAVANSKNTRIMADSAVVNIVQSQNDARKYRFILLDNGLKTLLISDPPSTNQKPLASHMTTEERTTNNGENLDTDDDESRSSDGSEYSSATATDDEQGSSDSDSYNLSDGISHRPTQANMDSNSDKLSAAALCVAIGSFSDPPDIPGLAHFLEHMVFMGSEKYPNENGFDSYLGKHGGSSDAFTDCEQTMFHFDVEKNYFERALDRFAQFFIRPLMKKDAVDRETEAVDSEFEVALPDDDNRIEQLLGNLANEFHPMSKFLWGNAETLKVRPKATGIDIYQRLKEFWEKHYRAQNMTLVVQAKDSLDVLEKMIRSIFSAIPSSFEPNTSFSHLDPPYEMSVFNKVYKVIPVQDNHILILTWALPSVLSHYRVKPLYYLGWLLGHEGKGSIDSYLKKRHLAFDLEAGAEDSGTENNSSCSLFQIQITLTDEGFKNVDEVIKAIFQYLSMLRKFGPQRQIFDEIKMIQENQFMWIEQIEPQEYVQELALAMVLYKPEDYLTGSSLLWDYDEKLINDCTDALTCEKVNIVIMSNTYQEKGICDKECPWFKTRYGIEEIPNDWLDKWKAPELNAELHLPAPNKFIATDFSLKEADIPASSFPVIINEGPINKLSYKKDNIFSVPRAFVYIFLKSNFINRSAQSMCMTDIYVKLLEKSLTELAYDASQADLSYAIKAFSSGVVIKIGGFSQKMAELFQVIVDKVFKLELLEKEFEMAKDEWKTIYHNHSIKPSSLNKDLRLSLLVHNHWTMIDRLYCLPSITSQLISDFIKEFLSTAATEMLIQGNITVQEAKELENYLLEKMDLSSRSPLPLQTTSISPQDDEIVVTELPDYAIYHRTNNLNTNDDNCVITNYYQHGPTGIREQQMMQLLLTHMEEPCFDTLRTNKQLGYIVYSSSRQTHGILGYSITIQSQSTKFSMRYLDEEIENFLNNFKIKIDRMKSERFNRLVKSIITLKRCEDTNMKEEVERNWGEIIDGTYLFNRLQREIQELEQINLEDFKLWSSKHLSTSEVRRKFGVQIIGTTSSKQAKKTSSAPSIGKRPGSSLETSKKHHRSHAGMQAGSSSKKKTCAVSKRIDDDVLRLNSKSTDAHGNLYVKDISAFKTSCKKYPASKIL